MRTPTGDVLRNIGLAAVYFAAARFGLAFEGVAGIASLVWLPTGISLAAILLLGYRVWPGIFVGAVLGNVIVEHGPIHSASIIAAGNTLEAVVAAYILRRIPGFGYSLETVRSAIGLLLVSLLCTLISATVGVATLLTFGLLHPGQGSEAWRAWWIGDMVGALLVTPIILVWSEKPKAHFTASWVERGALAIAVVIVGVYTFFTDAPSTPSLTTPFHQTDALLVVLIWAAVRRGQRGATTATFLISAMAVAGTVLGLGPFTSPIESARLLSLQTFMASVSATFVLLGATISERRVTEEALRRAHKEAADANLVKSEFLAVMSHELRTPLNAIAGYSELLQTGVYGELNEKQQDAVERIHRNEKQLLAQLEEVFGFVRAEKGEVAVQSESVRVADAFDAVEPLVRTEIQRKHVDFRRALSRPRLAVQADPKSLQQILASLLSNASKFTNEGGEIVLGADPEGGSVRIWVRDTGIGIAQEEIQRVFDPFFQTERGTTRRVSGIGLGLTIARDLARRMSGELTIASKPGSGTTASIVLPAA